MQKQLISGGRAPTIENKTHYENKQHHIGKLQKL